jgi:hypothetical protein
MNPIIQILDSKKQYPKKGIWYYLITTWSVNRTYGILLIWHGLVIHNIILIVINCFIVSKECETQLTGLNCTCRNETTPVSPDSKSIFFHCTGCSLTESNIY